MKQYISRGQQNLTINLPVKLTPARLDKPATVIKDESVPAVIKKAPVILPNRIFPIEYCVSIRRTTNKKRKAIPKPVTIAIEDISKKTS